VVVTCMSREINYDSTDSIWQLQTSMRWAGLPLALINAGLAQGKGRSGLAWWAVSLLLDRSQRFSSSYSILRSQNNKARRHYSSLSNTPWPGASHCLFAAEIRQLRVVSEIIRTRFGCARNCRAQ